METRPSLARENWFGSRLARVDGDLGQLYIAIKLALSKFTFLLTPPKAGGHYNNLYTTEREKGTVSF